jgi:hypothetical protein
LISLKEWRCSVATIRRRAEARERLRQMFEKQLDQFIPADEQVPLKGEIFRDFEEQADQIKAAILPTFLEERCALDNKSMPEVPGNCPHCGSVSTRWIEEPRQQERLSTAGPVVLSKHPARCRDCGRTFSPSGKGLSASNRSTADGQGGRTPGA